MIPVNKGQALVHSYLVSGITAIKTAIFSCIVLAFFAPVLPNNNLYVFYPTTERPQVVDEKIENVFEGISVTVFVRFNDFMAKIEIDPPVAIITKPALIVQLTKYAIVLNGARKGTTEETYVLMSVNNRLDVEAVNSETTIGVIDVLGRVDMKSFLKRMFPVEPRMKRVTKLEDLLPLLSFNMAQGILIEDVFVDYFLSTSQLPFKITPLESMHHSAIIALGVQKGSTMETIQAILKKGNTEINKLFVVDSWK